MIIHETNIKYCRPPLPFVGNKRLYQSKFCEIIKRFDGVRVFDAFGGSGLLSRFAKDTRPDLDVTLNDISDYEYRLSCVDDTNEILHRLRDAGAYRCDKRYVRYDKETEEKLKYIVSDAMDYYTACVNVFARHGNTVRAKCRTKDYDVKLCEHWYDGLNKTHIELKTFDDLKNGYGLYILDPPYKTKPGFTGSGERYIGDDKGAIRFCMECINSGEKIILFDEVDSDLIKLFCKVNPGFYAYKPNNRKSYANDIMVTNV